ncbi:MAG TPA: TMEM175 family protein [Thermoanaerobaculia bacterium]|jgi:uncharacterized membrane protein|nr:TMEM175 family protein [Thermoanaerobaculia bacterium]
MTDKQPFRLRGREVTRVEAFSDVVFGFALTLIVVSLEVPATFDELMKTMKGFPAFAICFAILTWVWHVHHTFFRRYALTDEITIALNAALLFLVLFYTYPLKYMFSTVTGQFRGGFGGGALMVIYGVGFAGIFTLFLAMYAHAWRLRHELELNELEQYDTRTNMIMYASYVFIGILSATLGATLEGPAIRWTGLMYFLLGPVSGFIGYWRGSRRHKLQVAIAQRMPNAMQTDAVPRVAAVGPN